MAEVSAALRQAILALPGPIAVFGARGFIGANLIRTLLAVREDCNAVTHPAEVPWRLVQLPARNVLSADVTDRTSLETLFRCHEFRTIFHLASFGDCARPKHADQVYRAQFIGLVNLVEGASKTGFAALVHVGSSSGCEFGSPEPHGNAPLLPNSHYAVSEAASAYLLRYYGAVKNLPAIHLRLPSVYGPFEEPDGFIPTLLSHAARGSYPRLVGPDVTRDFVYVDDAVEVTIAAALHGVRRLPGGSISVTSGTKTTLQEAVQGVRVLCGVKDEPVWGEALNVAEALNDGDGDPAEAQQILGWKARTPFHEGLRRTLAWQSSHGDIAPDAHVDVHLGPVRLSAVIACYKDAQAIPVMHQRLTEVFTSLGVAYEMIFVNDGSPDDTDLVLRDLTARDDHTLAIEHSRNFGSQNALLSGMQAATGDAVVLLDGDLQDPPEVIRAFYEKWREGHDVVYGRRVKREGSALMAICCKVFYQIFRGLSYVPIPIDAGDFALMDRKVVNELLALPETDQFLRGLRAWVGFKQTGVDYFRPKRVYGHSNNGWLRNIWWARKGVFSFTFVPIELLGYAGATMTVFSFLAFIYQIVDVLRRPQAPHGITTIIVLLLLVGSLNVFAIAVVGEYVIRIFEESKRRPKFIRKALRQGGNHFNSAIEIETFLRSRSLKTAAQRPRHERSVDGCEE